MLANGAPSIKVSLWFGMTFDIALGTMVSAKLSIMLFALMHGTLPAFWKKYDTFLLVCIKCHIFQLPTRSESIPVSGLCDSKIWLVAWVFFPKSHLHRFTRVCFLQSLSPYSYPSFYRIRWFLSLYRWPLDNMADNLGIEMSFSVSECLNYEWHFNEMYFEG